ncbi:MAG: mechanosensitive ion channel domain-containing protein [Maricaulaceae bacterium]
MSFSAISGAQTLSPPDGVTLTSLETSRSRIENRQDLDADKKAIALASYDSAITALKNATLYTDNANEFKTLLKTSAVRVNEIEAEISELNDLPSVTLEDDMSDMNSQNLAELQQSLIIKETELRILRSGITDLTTELDALQNRRLIAPDEQVDVLSRIKDLSTRLLTTTDASEDIAKEAQLISLRSRLYARRAQSAMLEQEIASFAERQKQITANRELNQIRADRVSTEVEALQKLTGKKRLIDANSFTNKAEATAAELGDVSPLLIAYAQENIDIARSLNEIAQSSSQLPSLKAALRSQVDILDADLNTTASLIALGSLSRQSATMLRKLSKDIPSVKVIRADIKAVNEDITTATQSRLLAQDRLRKFLPNENELEFLVRQWEFTNPELPQVTSPEIGLLNMMYLERRDILTEVANAASERIDELNSLQIVQKTVLDKSRELANLLDQNLLWLPSIPSIKKGWPKKVIKGAFEVFNLKKVETVSKQLHIAGLQHIWLVALFVIGIIICYHQRSTLWKDIERRSRLVGRVQKDSHWHTPAVLVSCIIIALPLALIFTLFSLLLILSGSTDPFIGSLSSAFKYLAVFTLFFLSWRAWDRDLSLFDTHFNLPKSWRHVVNKQFRWFIPLTGTAGTLMVLTEGSSSANVHDGFSLFAFIIVATCLSVVFYNVLWKRRNSQDHILSADSSIGNYKTPLATFLISIPLLAAVLAGAGYYETTAELFYRFFISGCLLVGTYVAHGIVRRNIMVGKRRLSLRQAIERRDKAVKMRAQQAAAEERGETAPPPAVDYDQIDIESLNRQTLKLINTIFVIAFAALMWMIWSDLLPALTFFNNVELGHYMSVGTDGEEIITPITLWNVMQAVVISVLTVLTARNLPGLLDMFALNKMGFDAGSRYAIVTIMGYVIFGIGAFMALDRLGLQWSQLKWVITGLSVGIGLGLQKIIANFVSGLIILFERPVRLGDYVTIGEQSGTISRIQIRATTLMDLDNREILIPNEALISERVTNWTLSDSVTRLNLFIGIAYGSNTEQARDIMLNVLKADKIVLDTPPPRVLFIGFGDSSLDFELQVYLKKFEDRVPTRHSINMALNKALDKAGIEIPFPQRDLHIISDKTKTNAKAKPKKSSSKPKTA